MDIPRVQLLGLIDWQGWDFVQFLGPKIFFSVICGGLIGLERELKSKAAGMKTNILICVGAALYAAVSLLISSTYSREGYYGDPSRITAQIVSGIGFLGGGAIIQARGTVVGLTTAAMIWLVAAIGICVGIGEYAIAVATSVMIVMILTFTSWFEEKVLYRKLWFGCRILVTQHSDEVRNAINHALEKYELSVDDYDILSKGKNVTLRIKYRGTLKNHRKFLMDLWGINGISEVSQE